MAQQDGTETDVAVPLRTADGAMNPDHPMLQRAQQALARQLQAKRMRVKGELREKQTDLQVRGMRDKSPFAVVGEHVESLRATLLC